MHVMEKCFQRNLYGGGRQREDRGYFDSLNAVLIFVLFSIADICENPKIWNRDQMIIIFKILRIPNLFGNPERFRDSRTFSGFRNLQESWITVFRNRYWICFKFQTSPCAKFKVPFVTSQLFGKHLLVKTLPNSVIGYTKAQIVIFVWS